MKHIFKWKVRSFIIPGPSEIWIREVAYLLYVFGKVDNKLSSELHFIFPLRKHLLNTCWDLGGRQREKDDVIKIQCRLRGISNLLQVSEAWWQQLTFSLAVLRWIITYSKVWIDPLPQNIFPYLPDTIGHMSGWNWVEPRAGIRSPVWYTKQYLSLPSFKVCKICVSYNIKFLFF